MKILSPEEILADYLEKDEAKDAMKTGSGCYLSEQDVIILMKRYGQQAGIIHIKPGHVHGDDIIQAMEYTKHQKGQVIVIDDDIIIAAEHILPAPQPILNFPIVAYDSKRDIADGQTKRRDRRAKQRKNKR